MTAELGTLFPCERFAQDFPRGMPLRTCLRRQLERQASVKRGVHGPPRRPFCAEQCALGRENRAHFPGLALSACPACGAALIGATSCEACTKPARLIEKQPPSTRLWTPGAVPDVAIGPVHTSAPTTSPAHPAPAQPEVTETQMPCKTCGKEGHNARTCPTPAKKPASGKPPASKPAVSKTTAASAPRAETPAAAPSRARASLDALDVPALLARRAQLRADLADLDAALRARAEKLEADHKALLAELGSAA